MPKHNRVLFSERCRTLAEECRAKAQSFHDDKQRSRMLDLAADYERKSLQAAGLEASLQETIVDAPSLIPQIAEAFVTRLKAGTESQLRSPKKPAKRRTTRRKRKAAT